LATIKAEMPVRVEPTVAQGALASTQGVWTVKRISIYSHVTHSTPGMGEISKQ